MARVVKYAGAYSTKSKRDHILSSVKYDWILMFMRITAFFAPFIVILAGICGFYLRVSELLNAFDINTGLPEKNSATTMWLAGLSAVFVLFVIIFAIKTASKHKSLTGFENAFGTDPLAYPIIFIVVGILWIAGTYFYYSYISLRNIVSTYDIIFVVFSAISAISVTLFAIEMYQDSRRKISFALSVVPTAFMCFWLIFMYSSNASNPVLLSYIYQCLAIVASALSFYFTAGFLYGKPAPGKSIVAYYTAIYFGIVTLADNHDMGIKVIFFTLIVVNLVHSTMLIRNLQRK